MEHAKVKTLEVYEDKKSGWKATSQQISARSHVALTPDRIINQTEGNYKYYTKEHLPPFDYPHKQFISFTELTTNKLHKMQNGNYFNKFQTNIKRNFNQVEDRIKIFCPKWRETERVLLKED